MKGEGLSPSQAPFTAEHAAGDKPPPYGRRAAEAQAAALRTGAVRLRNGHASPQVDACWVR